MGWKSVIESGVSMSLGATIAKWGLGVIDTSPLWGGIALIVGGVLVVTNFVLFVSGAISVWTESYFKAKMKFQKA